MNKTEFLKMAAKFESKPGFELVSLARTPYIVIDFTARKATLAAAALAEVRNEKGETFHVTVTYQKKGGYDATCGDQFLQRNSMLEETLIDEYIEAALEPIPSFMREDLESRLRALAKTKVSADCNFWTLRRTKKASCDHVQHVVKEFIDEAYLDSLKDDYEELFKVKVETKASENTPMHRYAFKTPVFIEGDQGSGKTTWVRNFANQNGFAFVELAGHESVESIDLLGHYVRSASGEYVWKDGKLAEAFRLAGTGQKTVLLIDEMLRIPQRQLSVLLTAFSPFQGQYRLSTGRMVKVIDGIGTEEVLSCEVESLAIYATTNVGSQFAVDELDPAMAERFIPVRMDTSTEQVFAILADICERQKMSLDVATKLAEFLDKMKAAVNSGLVNGTPTTRTLVRALEGAKSMKDVGQRLDDQALLWVGRDLNGAPNEEQLKNVRTLLSACFGYQSPTNPK